MRNVILVGFMGTGKSSAGMRVAATLGAEFVDMDTLIEQREGQGIPEIFAQLGEPYFRGLERALVRELAAKSNLVVSCGGGIVLNPDNIKDFSASGTVICLKASPETILKRVEKETHRPLLQHPDKLERIRNLLAKRQTLYDAIPLFIDTERLDSESVACSIVNLLNTV